MKIGSRDNSLLRRARAVRDGKATDSIFIEGLRLSEEALRSNLNIEAVIYSEQIAQKDRAATLIASLERAAAKSATLSEKLLESISYTRTPQGVVVLAKRPMTTEKEFTDAQTSRPLIVVLHGVNNPVNLGAILRTAEAAGCTGALTTTGTTDAFAAKSLRGAMGAAFRLPIWTGVDYYQAIEWCRRQAIQTISAHAKAGQSYTDVDWLKPAALVVGAESKGLSAEEIAATDEAVRIPMNKSTESLNVAVAAGIILYEARRQRGNA